MISGNLTIYEELKRCGSATVHEAADRRGALPSEIKPVDDKIRLCGPAFTVLCPAGDNLWLHKAIVAAKPGDIIVADVGNFYEAGYWGEIMTHAALNRGLGGLVINGCVRDKELLVELPLPVFSRGLCIQGTKKDKAARGALSCPIRVGNEIIYPGDIIVGDADGVVILEPDKAARVLEAAKEREKKEERIIQDLKTGKSTLEIYNLG